MQRRLLTTLPELLAKSDRIINGIVENLDAIFPRKLVGLLGLFAITLLFFLKAAL